MMDDMKVANDFECPQECETIKYTVREKIVPLDPENYCKKPKSIWLDLNYKLRNKLPELVNFYYSKLYNKYNTTVRIQSSRMIFTEAVFEDICKQMLKEDIAVVSVYFPHGTYTR